MTKPALPLVTIAVPSYNHAPYIAECVASLIAQDYPRIELIVIDDGSRDGSAAVVEGLTEQCRARFERFELIARENQGLCNTLNQALDWAQGEYFVTADSDDRLLPAHVSRLLPELEQAPQLAAVYGGAMLINAAGKRYGELAPVQRDYRFADILNRDKAMISSGGLLRTAALRAVGGYRADLYIEDWYMMLKLTEGGAMLRTLPDPVVEYRIHTTNISANNAPMLQARLQILDLYRDHPGHAWRVALVQVEIALSTWRRSRGAALGLLIKALRSDVRIAVHPLFLGAVARLLLPTALIDWLIRRGGKSIRPGSA